MDKGFLTLNEVSEYLNVKRSTLYSWVKTKEIPCYKVHKMIRFKKEDVDVWMENHRREEINIDKKVRSIIKAMNRPATGINSVVKKIIAEAKQNLDTSNCGRPDQDKAKREVEHGNLS